ncbi:hypothetical protein K450DRAFT_239515 [Umbelopsis ramanniana AG]|uniref:Uncharacterized protein n=1 Tax=Umbelopsis ramanniana AG TaxID=1314678 RepID=A0AAD5EA04_UMBRA|nr:uncharacterized protein K450DRAFT_239515 [Umbelopsis ramanniana AG]KAI8579878.1 hypothetical protein K450DRAFT_239515 [Umbelopsis ramanniana AG]
MFLLFFFPFPLLFLPFPISISIPHLPYLRPSSLPSLLSFSPSFFWDVPVFEPSLQSSKILTCIFLFLFDAPKWIGEAGSWRSETMYRGLERLVAGYLSVVVLIDYLKKMTRKNQKNFVQRCFYIL